MYNGFIKVSAATPKIKVADTVYNTCRIKEKIDECEKQNVKLLVLPELCITGYTCSDLFFHMLLQAEAKKALIELCRYTEGKNIAVVVGLPLTFENSLYNCAAVIFDGEILGVIPKSNLPNYNEFYEKRHFTNVFTENSEIEIDGRKYPFGTKLLFSCKSKREFTFAVEICEDLWVPIPVSAYHAAAGATIIANLSASNETVGKADYRRNLIKGNSARLVCGYVFADAGDGESTTDMVFSSQNMICENGIMLSESKLYENMIVISEVDVEALSSDRRKLKIFDRMKTEEYRTIDFDCDLTETKITRYIDPHPFIPSDVTKKKIRCEEILSIQSQSLKKRIEHTNAKSLVVGVSGGLDSCLALLVSVKAMDLLNRNRRDIIAVTMPCFGTTKRTKSNASLLCEKLGVSLREINITKSVRQHFEDIGQNEEILDVTYENSQARERTQILMDIANMSGGIVVGTGDLSELALGWATYNGDHMSMYGVNSSVPKTLIRHIVGYISETSDDKMLSKVLNDILATPVSPELLPAIDGDISQKTEDIVGPYELHDFFLYYFVRFGFSPKKIYRLSKIAFSGVYDDDTLIKWLKNFIRRFFSQQFKRSCLPDGPKVGSVALSPRSDWRMPSDASSDVWMNDTII